VQAHRNAAKPIAGKPTHIGCSATMYLYVITPDNGRAPVPVPPIVQSGAPGGNRDPPISVRSARVVPAAFATRPQFPRGDAR
jgi:hypothetical protein